MRFADSFNEILLAFAEAGVEFLVVGGYAVNFYGYDRTTNDLDIWINPIESNKSKITKVLVNLGYISKNDEHVTALDFSQPSCFRLGDENYKVDVFTHMVGINFNKSWPEKILFETEGERSIYFISLNHLIINKMLTGRDKDKVDVSELQKIVQFKK